MAKKSKPGVRGFEKGVCHFCKLQGKVTTFKIWTATAGGAVEISTSDGRIVRGPSFDDLVEHKVTVCRSCNKGFRLRHRRWLAISSVGVFLFFIVVVTVSAAIYIICGRNPNPTYADSLLLGKALYALGAACVALLLSFFAMIGAIWVWLRGKVSYDATETAIAKMTFRQLDEDANVGLGSGEFDQLQPQQIRGNPRKVS